MKTTKTIPWIAVLAVLKVLVDHYLRLSEEDRKNINQVAKESKGMPNRITPEHKQHLKTAASNLNKTALGKDLFAVASPLPKRIHRGSKG